MRHVVFRLGKEHYALPLSAIREVVVPPKRFTPVPRAPAIIRGVMNLRGRVVTVVELGTLIGAGEQESGERVVLLDRGRRDLGLLVSEVEGVESIERVTGAPGQRAVAVRGVARVGGWAVTVLDPDGLDQAVLGWFAAASGAGAGSARTLA
jgi:purine-binding chemotaxis protein CheW